jgi:hypothetical protein
VEEEKLESSSWGRGEGSEFREDYRDLIFDTDPIARLLLK